MNYEIAIQPEYKKPWRMYVDDVKVMWAPPEDKKKKSKKDVKVVKKK